MTNNGIPVTFNLRAQWGGLFTGKSIITLRGATRTNLIAKARSLEEVEGIIKVSPRIPSSCRERWRTRLYTKLFRGSTQSINAKLLGFVRAWIVESTRHLDEYQLTGLQSGWSNLTRSRYYWLRIIPPLSSKRNLFVSFFFPLDKIP